MLGDFYCLLIRGKSITEPERERVIGIYNSYGKDAMYEMAKKKKILPFAANTFCFCGLDIDFWNCVTEEYRQRNSKILYALDKAYTALKKNGVKKMFVSENFSALLLAKDDISLFASGDVDNYADVSEKEKIYTAFEAIGWTKKERFSGKNQIAVEFFPPEDEMLPDGFYISVDFNPLARLKLPCFIVADEFVNWDSVSTFGDTNITLPPADALAYICMLHISLHSFSRAPDIRLYIDLLNVSRTDVDYEKVSGWCKRDNTCVRVATATSLSNKLMGTGFPSCVTELSTKKEKLIKLVYNEKNNDLIYEPKGLKILRIEILCDDCGRVGGIKKILLPDRDWMDKTYGGHGLGAYIKHVVKVL